MATAVLLAFADGSKEFLADAHVHGVRDGLLQVATGAPGAGVDAEVVRTVAVLDLAYAETCSVVDDPGTSGGSWSMGSPRAD